MAETKRRPPHKAYLVSYVVGVHMEGRVYANSAAEAVEIAMRDDACEATGETYRVVRPRAWRDPEEDR